MMKLDSLQKGNSSLETTEIIPCLNRSGFSNFTQRNVCPFTSAGTLARIVIRQRANVNTTEDGKDAPAGESGSERRQRAKGRLIRVDDLLSEQDVKGGHQVLFGLTDTIQTNNNQN